MKKNKSTTVRISSEHLELLKAEGLSVQKILDDWIKNNIVTTSKSRIKKQGSKNAKN